MIVGRNGIGARTSEMSEVAFGIRISCAVTRTAIAAPSAPRQRLPKTCGSRCPRMLDPDDRSAADRDRGHDHDVLQGDSIHSFSVQGFFDAGLGNSVATSLTSFPALSTARQMIKLMAGRWRMSNNPGPCDVPTSLAACATASHRRSPRAKPNSYGHIDAVHAAPATTTPAWKPGHDELAARGENRGAR